MEAPRRVDPSKALEVLVGKARPRKGTTHAIESAPRGYLATAIDLGRIPCGNGRGTGARRAAWNGYAAPAALAGSLEGALCRVLGVIDSSGRALLETGSSTGSTSCAIELWRLESGAPVPDACDRIIRVRDAVLTGAGIIRIDQVPEPGAGIAPAPGTAGSPGSAIFEPGTFLDGRLRAQLAACGVRSVALRPSFTVALAAVGAEVSKPGSPGTETTPDATGPWLEEAIESLGLTVLPLGILPDSPERIRDAILHLRGRSDVLLLSGGMGDGVTDRTVEALQRFDAQISFEAIALEGARGLLLARAQDVEVLGIGGKPLETAALFDLFVRPALLARLGASPTLWDWRRFRLEVPAPPPSRGPRQGGASIVLPAALRPDAALGVHLEAWAPGTPFLSRLPGQEGWAILPASVEGPLRAHYQPLATT
ncbi:MAG TPA: molybdopterin-binding protein [Planctomycetota bacterium]|nr:molybdopterin-binding protein [Planctomycetota bacterium]